MARVLITGATGNIGRKLRAHLAAEHELRLLCLNPEGDPAVTTADLEVYDESWGGGSRASTRCCMSPPIPARAPAGGGSRRATWTCCST